MFADFVKNIGFPLQTQIQMLDRAGCVLCVILIYFYKGSYIVFIELYDFQLLLLLKFVVTFHIYNVYYIS